MESSESFDLDNLFEQESTSTNPEATSPLDQHHDTLFNKFENRIYDMRKIEMENNDLENTAKDKITDITGYEDKLTTNKIESTQLKNQISTELNSIYPPETVNEGISQVDNKEIEDILDSYRSTR